MASKANAKTTVRGVVDLSPPIHVTEKRFYRSRYEPVPRFAHSTAVVKDKLYLWGGWQKGFPKVHSSPEKLAQCLKMEVMDLNKGEWSQVDTYGEPPLGVRGYATTTIDYKLYYFGGYCGHDYCRYNTIKCLDSTTLEWSDIHCTNPHRSPMKKNACGMVSFKDGGHDYLFICGGAGMLCSANEPDAIYIPYKENPDYGWTNEAHVFDLSSGSWVTPTITGDKPPPSAGFTLTQISPNTAIFIGGINPFTQECINAVYKVELTANSAHWTQININTPTDAKPRARHDHSAVCISDVSVDPCILIAGGRDVRWRTLDDVWVINCESGIWKKLDVPEGVACRQYTSLSLRSISSNCGYAVMFGGVKEWMKETAIDDQPMIADTTVIELGRSNEGVWSVTAVLDSVMLSTTEEYKSRMIQSLFNVLGKNFVKKHYNSIKDNTNGSRSVYEQTIFDLQQQILAKDVRISALESQIEEMSHDLEKTKSELSNLQLNGHQSSASVPPASTPSIQAPPTATVPSSIVPSSSVPVSSIPSSPQAEQLAVEVMEDHVRPYILSSSDIVISSGATPIHKGTYGYTVLGQYMGGVVSARVLERSPSTQYDKMVFMREVVKGCRVVHPNIHMFMGVVIDDASVMIVNESMPTNLRYELDKKAFTKQDIINITLDLARALTYLHSTKPRPIIHRCVYTPFVFLERLAFKWRAKLSDTILPNYYYYINDSVSVAMETVFQPPEAAAISISHTPKYDIYSMGVVLLEVNCRTLPHDVKADKDGLLSGIKWPVMVSLIGDCLAESESARPKADEILKTLEQTK